MPQVYVTHSNGLTIRIQKKLPRELFFLVSICMIDIVTVVFAEELPILEVQAHSIELYCQDLGIKNIYVIVNDQDQVADQICKDWWGQLKDCVQIVSRSQFDCRFVDNGWVSQQALKLLGASLSQNTWSMILDAKTIIADHVCPDIFVEDDTRLRLKIYDVLPVFLPSAKIAGKLFGVDLQGVPEPNGVPFIFHNSTVRELIDQVSQLTGENFAEWFQDQGMLTEFILYSSYVQHKHGDLGKIYTATNQKKLSGNICHSEVNLFDQKLQQLKILTPLTIGVHRRAWIQLTQQQKESYVDYLLSRNISKAKKLL